MKNVKLVGLWIPDRGTWEEYKDAGLYCDAGVLKEAFELMKNNPMGSHYALLLVVRMELVMRKLRRMEEEEPVVKIKQPQVRIQELEERRVERDQLKHRNLESVEEKAKISIQPNSLHKSSLLSAKLSEPIETSQGPAPSNRNKRSIKSSDRHLR